MTFVFAKCSEETTIYPLTVWEIAEIRTKDKTLDKLNSIEKHKPQLMEDIQVLFTCHPTITTTVCSRMVSPLLTTPRDNTSQRDYLCYNVLERLAPLSVPTSKSAINAKSTRDTSNSMVN